MVQRLVARGIERVPLTPIRTTSARAAWGVFMLSALTAQTVSGPQSLTFLSDTDDTEQPYALYLPKNYNPARKYPLVVSLHAENSNQRLNLRRVFGKGNLPGETEAEASRMLPRLPDVEFIVVCPFARGGMGYQGIAEKDVYDMLADVRHRFSVDDDRIYLTGIAMGGAGALWLALTRPDIWAAVAVVCPSPAEEAHAFVPNGLNVPFQLFHGSFDPLTPAEVSRRWQHDLLESGTSADLTEYPTVRHNAWDPAYKDAAVFKWFAQFRRQRFPDRVHFATDRYRYRSAYWVEIDGLTPGTRATIDVRFTAANQLVVRAENLDGFTLSLNGHPKYSAARPLLIAINGVDIRSGRAVSFTKSAKGWQAGRYVPSPGSKRTGLEGPIARAFGARQIYVYGTAGQPTIERLLARRNQALEAANWSTARSKVRVSFRVTSDQELTPDDFNTADLILFGTRESNDQIARLSPRLPVSLNVSAADYGLIFIYPGPSHYIVINSGLPWWTGSAEARRGGPPFAPEKLAVLETFKDYILFRGSLENVIAEGLFTRDWKLPPSGAQSMKSTGAIETK